MTQSTSAVLLMAYGTPATLDDVGPYFTHIRGGRTPSPEAIAHLRERYERVGGGTPLLAITQAVREGLEAALASGDEPARVYVGMKHWHPYIDETMRQMASDGIERVTCVALAPHFSRMSVGAYRKAVETTQAELGNPFEVRFVDSWHRQAEFLEMMATLVDRGLRLFPAGAAVLPVFTAHSLPVRIREWKDPYEIELLTSSALVADRLSLGDWRFAWQSAGGTSEPWIGPDILDYLEELKAQGARAVLQVPIGFVAEHLEILYDIDIEAIEKARSLGMHLERTALPNDSPALIDTLASVVAEAAGQVSAVGP